MHVVVAAVRDIPGLCELLSLLFSQEAEFAPDPVRQAKGLRAIMDDPAVGMVLVLKEGDEMVGMVSLLFTVSTFLGAEVALLEDMIVHPAHRGKGAGTMLLQAAREKALERGCGRITLLTDEGNVEARDFYEKNGFVRSGMVPYRLML
jgi:GNAT superfamily N-acetyltransferase